MITADQARTALYQRIAGRSVGYPSSANPATDWTLVTDLTLPTVPAGTRNLFLVDDEVRETGRLWALLRFVIGTRTPTSLSGRRMRVEGSVVCVVSTAVGVGTQPAETIAQQIAELFDPDPASPVRTADGQTIYLLGSRTQERSVGADSRWYQQVVEAPFTYYDVRNRAGGSP